MEWEYLTFVVAGALAGGFVSGLAGFGTGITALGLWLYVLSPAVAATLVIVCSVASQLQTLPRIWHAIEVRRVVPFIIPGLIGVPIGTLLLSRVDVRWFKLSIACLLIIYATHSLLHRTPRRFARGGRAADGLIGFGGGLLGGLAGLSGPLPTIWADIRGWAKDEKRSIFQSFNLTILLAALISHWMAGLVNRELIVAAAIALPGTFVGAWLGATLYGRVREQRFKEIVLTLLGISGCVLIWTNI